MPRYNISTPRPTRRDRAREADELALEQDRTSAANQNAMINQAVQLYGLSQARAMQPEQLRQMKLQNDAVAAQLGWFEPNMQQQYASRDLANTSAQLGNEAQSLRNDWGPYQLGLDSRIKEEQLGQSQLVFPEQYQGLQAANKRTEIENRFLPQKLQLEQNMGIIQKDQAQHERDWAQPMSEARHAATTALAGQRGGMSIQEAMMLRQAGYITEEEFNAVLPPEMQAALAQRRAREAAARAAGIAQDQQIQAQPNPVRDGPAAQYVLDLLTVPKPPRGTPKTQPEVNPMEFLSWLFGDDKSMELPGARRRRLQRESQTTQTP